MTTDQIISAIGLGANVLTNGINMGVSAGMTERDRQFSKYMSDLAWERNIQAWNMQNEYNDPTNTYRRQLEGIIANGLNPNLVYGGSSSITGSAGAVSPYRFEGYHSTSIPQYHGDLLQSYLSTKLMQTQIAAQEANNRLINARAKNEEDRNPGVVAKSDEASYRWNTIKENYNESYDEALRAQLAKIYWTGVRSQYEAEYAQDKRTMSDYDAMMAEWLNTEEAPGTGMTYRQYMEACKAYLPGEQFAKMKAEVLYIGARMAYLAEQEKYLVLKQEFQGYVNRLAKYGRSLGNDWVTLLISGIASIFGKDPEEILRGIITDTGKTQTNMPPTYPGP